MYGFDRIAELTHELETLYDLIRDGQIELSEDILQLTFRTGDHIRNLLKLDTDLSETEEMNQAQIVAAISSIVARSGVVRKPVKIKMNKNNSDEKKIRTWHILIELDESIERRCVNVFNIFHDLFQLGEFKVEPNEYSENAWSWNIILVSDCTKNEIEDILFIILNNCKITILAEIDIFNLEELEKREHLFDDLETAEEIASDNKLKPNADYQIKPDINTHLNIKNDRIIVNAAKLDTLMYLVSELVTTKSELQLSIDFKNLKKLKEISDKLDKLSKQFRDNALNIRLVSFQEMLSHYNRLIRDLSHALDKKVEFISVGENTELDKNIIDTITEPIMHLIRNCIDHGIESPDERRAAGKNETGVIKFFAYKLGNFVFIQISDDGRGIETEKIKEKAIQKGIIRANQNISEKEIWNLIFLPGFSTAESLTQVSGRGVGMDVVRKKIEELRGEISIDSEKGLGTSFTIKLQQTISIIDTLLISCDTLKIAIPIEDIENCELVSNTIIQQNHNRLIPYKGALIPYLNLHKVFELTSPEPDKWRTIVINRHKKFYAILTDRIIGEYQAVIKPLGKTFKGQDFLSGASILGDGSIAFLLDTDKLKKL